MDRKINKKYIFIFIITVIATVAITLLLANVFEKKQEAKLYPSVLKPVADNEIDSKIWGENFPFEYDTFLKTQEDTIPTFYGGSKPFSRIEKYPNLVTLFAGNPFSKDYNEERGHYWSTKDVHSTKRINEKSPNTCITCKSSQVGVDIQKIGAENFYKAMFKDVGAHYTQAIGCLDCHNPKTMELRVNRPAFIEAMQRRGIDINKATRQEMRSYVCAQCHVEYYFKGDGKYLTFPWDKGLQIDSIEAYYEQIGFKDFVHEISGTPILKMQHPEFELWSSGIHARSGVSCADCHMPYQKTGSVKVTSHWIRSPLKNINTSCQTCHKWSDDELTSRVKNIQDKTFESLTKTEIAIVDAINSIKKAKDAGATDEQLAKARQFHRRAQLRWDFISAENSMGFHSPQETMRTLADAINYARMSQMEAELLVKTLSTK